MGYNVNRQQPITMKVDRVGNPADKIIDYAYEYYTQPEGLNNNRIRKITDGLDGNYTVNYSYDDYNRLSYAQAGAYLRIYNYDAFGNLRTLTGNALNYAPNETGAPATNRISGVTENRVEDDGLNPLAPRLNSLHSGCETSYSHPAPLPNCLEY